MLVLFFNCNIKIVRDWWPKWKRYILMKNLTRIRGQALFAENVWKCRCAWFSKTLFFSGFSPEQCTANRAFKWWAAQRGFMESNLLSSISSAPMHCQKCNHQCAQTTLQRTYPAEKDPLVALLALKHLSHSIKSLTSHPHGPYGPIRVWIGLVW